MAETRFYRCNHCGNIIGMIHSAGVPVVCCGEKMQPLVPNTTDASGEKHVPVITVRGNEVHGRGGARPRIHGGGAFHSVDLSANEKGAGQRKNLTAAKRLRRPLRWWMTNPSRPMRIATCMGCGGKKFNIRCKPPGGWHASIRAGLL